MDVFLCEKFPKEWQATKCLKMDGLEQNQLRSKDEIRLTTYY